MNRPSQGQLRILAFDIGSSIAVELAAIKLRRRLAYGPRMSKPKPRRVRRIAAAISTELFKVGVAEIYRQRLRIRAALDQAVAAQTVETTHGRHARIPPQPRPSDRELTTRPGLESGAR